MIFIFNIFNVALIYQPLDGNCCRLFAMTYAITKSMIPNMTQLLSFFIVALQHLPLHHGNSNHEFEIYFIFFSISILETFERWYPVHVNYPYLLLCPHMINQLNQSSSSMNLINFIIWQTILLDSIVEKVIYYHEMKRWDDWILHG